MRKRIPKTGWVVIKPSQEPTQILECNDEMACINEPGDRGWVKPLAGNRLPLIVSFEQFFRTEEAAKTAYIAECLTKIDDLQKEIDLFTK